MQDEPHTVTIKATHVEIAFLSFLRPFMRPLAVPCEVTIYRKERSIKFRPPGGAVQTPIGNGRCSEFLSKIGTE